jgi:hypothetical protein
MMSAHRVMLIDAKDEGGRTTASLFSSLAARLLALHYTSGVSVIGSIIGGFAALGREASTTVEGARVRRALEESHAAINGNAIWSSLRIADWTTGLPPSPVLDHVRNDLALLLAADLPETLQQVPIPPDTPVTRSMKDVEAVTCLDCMVGLWAYSREIVRAVETLAEPRLPPRGEVVHPEDTGPTGRGSLLR